MPIVFSKPDGSVHVLHLSEKWLAANRLPSETTAEAVARLADGQREKHAILSDATMQLVPTAQMPADRAKRHKWRRQAGQCVVDDSVPDRVHPQQTILDRINAAATLDQTKQAMIDYIRMKG